MKPEHQGELLNIALKAMATRQEDRYADVIAFQDAIREYRSHAESITLASRARADFARGKQNRDYKDFSRATFGFEEAIALWAGNESARDGLAATKLAHAEAAYENGDFDLGLSVLDKSDQTHQPIILRLQDGINEREQRQSRLVLFRRVAAAMLAFILVGGAVALYLINDQKKQAEAARETALINEREAKEQKKNAEAQTKVSEEQTRLAKEQEAKALCQPENWQKQQRERADTKTIEAEENAAEAIRQSRLAKSNADAARKSAADAEPRSGKCEKSEGRRPGKCQNRESSEAARRGCQTGNRIRSLPVTNQTLPKRVSNETNLMTPVAFSAN